MPYRIKRDPEGVGGVGEYHAFKDTPPSHTLSDGWETVGELPREVKDGEAQVFNQPSEMELLKIRVGILEADNLSKEI